MADTTNTSTAATPEAQTSRRNEKVGIVVSTKMQKTIVVEIEMRKAHPKYKRVMKSNKKFYAHDEQNSAASATSSASVRRAPCPSSSAGRSRRSSVAPPSPSPTTKPQLSKPSNSSLGPKPPAVSSAEASGEERCQCK